MVPAVAATPWQAMHWVLELTAPFCQLGAVWPPWHLTLEQVSEGPVKVRAAMHLIEHSPGWSMGNPEANVSLSSRVTF